MVRTPRLNTGRLLFPQPPGPPGANEAEKVIPVGGCENQASATLRGCGLVTIIALLRMRATAGCDLAYPAGDEAVAAT